MRNHKVNSGIDISHSLLTHMLLYMKSIGIDGDKLAQDVGLNLEALSLKDARIPVETYLAIQELGVRLSGDECFGLHIGEFIEPRSYSVVGYLMANCATLGDAFRKAARYSRIVGSLIVSTTRSFLQSSEVVLDSAPFAPAMSRHCFDSAISGVLQMMRSMSGQAIRPVKVSFAFPSPCSTKEYERVFQCPLQFDKKHTSITMDNKVATIPVLQPDKGLLDYIESYARDICTDLDKGQPTARLVAQTIIKHLDDESLSIKAVATSLSMSTRTLQARLREEGTGFTEILDDTRRRLAEKNIRGGNSVEDITYLLGFSEPSVFRKAFKKWTGLTPREFANNT
jgi:AraC-like DNA-binding protein